MLLEQATAHIEPMQLLQRIPLDLHIPGLRDVIVRIIRDSRLQVTLLENCCRIFNNDTLALLQRLVHEQQRGRSFHARSACDICHTPIVQFQTTAVSSSLAAAAAVTMGGDTLSQQQARHNDNALMVFYCGHTVHQRCCAVAHPDTISLQLDSPLNVSTIKLATTGSRLSVDRLGAMMHADCPICTGARDAGDSEDQDDGGR